MPRLGDNRETHLSEAEIAEAALRLFDEGPDDPSARSLAAVLNVAPATLYHHVPSVAAIYQLAVGLIWEEAGRNMLELMPDPFAGNPADVLVASAVAVRRACLAHARAARYLAVTPESSSFMDQALGLLTHVFRSLGLEGEEAARALHAYSSFMIGAVLFAAARKAANEPLLDAQTLAKGRYRGTSKPDRDATRAAIDRVMDLSIVDPQRDEELFVDGLKRLIKSLSATD